MSQVFCCRTGDLGERLVRSEALWDYTKAIPELSRNYPGQGGIQG